MNERASTHFESGTDIGFISRGLVIQLLTVGARAPQTSSMLDKDILDAG